jgi:Flp pilus assembly protein TadG
MSTVQRKFKRDSRGAVAVIFAVCAVVVFGAAGMAVDFINASGVRASLQQALDGAVLAAAAAHVKNENEAEEVIAEYMASNWSLKYPTLDAQITQSWSEEAVNGGATVEMPTLISGVLGFDTMDVSVTSTATLGNTVIEVAMVVDNSSSMNPYLTTLKNSLETVVDTLTPNGTDENISFSVIPYSMYVNVGVGNKTKSWLSLSAADEPTWEGCVGSRNYPLDLDDTDSTAIPAVAGIECNPTALLPLTSDVASVKSWIAGLAAEVDGSFTGSGLIWGFRALSEREPFEEGKAYGDSQKVLIFLTDAYSTYGPSYPLHDNEDNVGDSIWIAQCSSVKAQGISLYTIAFSTDGDRQKMLRNCATSTSHAFTAENASDLKSAFTEIAETLATVYLSQ